MARNPVVCGLDIGTTNAKIVAIDRSGTVVARAKRSTPRNAVDLSIDARLLFETLEDMILAVCGETYLVEAVAAAGIGEDGVLVDESIEPLGEALAWFDPRRSRLFRDIEAQLAPVPGLGVATDSSRTIVGWLWASMQPDHDRAVSWVALTDFASSRWSSRPFMSDTLAARTSAWVPGSRLWLTDRVAATLRDEALLPPVIRTGDLVGPMRSARLHAAGVLADDAVVIAGGHDHPIGGWSVELLHPGAILDSMGTAEVVVAQSPAKQPVRLGQVDTAPGIRSEGVTLLRVEELARNVDWASQDPAIAGAIRSIMSGIRRPDDYVGSEVFVPGTQGGGRPSYTKHAPRSSHSRASAVVGSLARLGDGAIQAVADHMPRASRVYAAGGWARSPGWMEVKRALTGREITTVAEPEVTAVGAALLAATALGWPVSAEHALAAEPTRV